MDNFLIYYTMKDVFKKTILLQSVRKLRIILLTAVMLLTLTLVPAQPIVVDGMTFDTEFLEALAIVNGTLFTNPSDILSIQKDKVEALVDLSVAPHVTGITPLSSLLGIEYFVNLEIFQCRGNILTGELDLSALTKLWDLDCGNSGISSLKLADSAPIVKLLCEGNQLTSIDLSEKTTLKWLNLSNNPLAALDVSGLMNLEELFCFTSNGSPSGTLVSLDASGCTSLVVLDCFNNSITALDVAGCTSLLELYCNYNQLSSLDVSGLNSLETLYCNNNQLTSLVLTGLSGSGFHYLDISNNDLWSVDVTGLNGLYALWAAYNYFSAVSDIIGFESLTYYSWITGAAVATNYSFDPQKTPPVHFWQGGISSDWHNAGNWQPAHVPTATDIVTITGNAGHFPVLEEETIVAEIHFEPGAQIGGQSNLQAGKAFVRYDLSERNRWHMLAIPLGEVYPADFAFGGYPLTWVRTFTTYEEESVTKGGWVTAQKRDVPLAFGDGFVIWLDEDGGLRDDLNKGLKLLNDTLELPFFENYNANVNLAHDFASEVKALGMIGTSTFHNFVWNGMEYEVLSDGSNEYPVIRSFPAYQLAQGDVLTTPEFADGSFALIGNPFMAALDFDTLCTVDNLKTIKDVYHVWTGNRYEAYSSSETLDLTSLIAPLQGFIVEKADVPTPTSDVLFKESMTAVHTGAALRSSVNPENRLDIVARNQEAEVRTVIANREGGQAVFGNPDARKLMNEISDVPEIYTLKPYKNGSVAALINIIDNDDCLIPLGLATTYAGDITLFFSGMDSYNVNLSLIDAEANRTIDLTGLASCDYVFHYTPKKKANGVTAACEDRFFISISKTTTGWMETEAGKVNVFESNGFIRIVSGASNPIKEVAVYDLQGMLIYKANAINEISHTVDQNLPAGAYIVKVSSEKNAENVKVIKR